jgi:hypothetical protein
VVVVVLLRWREVDSSAGVARERVPWWRLKGPRSARDARLEKGAGQRSER